MDYNETLKKLSLEQKCALLSGAGEWFSHAFPEAGVESFWMSDGPNGLRKQEGAGDHLGLNESVKATCMPTAATVANSWDPQLGEEVGQALGEEAAAQRVNVLLGPGLNMKRSPLCGRNFEYFAEDPYLAGKMAAGYVRGIQSKGVAACPKHYAVNSQELRRMASDSIVDERAMREIYLTGFEIVVKESDPRTIMTSYNAVNGTYTNESKHLLKDILRDEFGFDGAVITDWGGNNDHVEGVRAGSSLEMPNPGYGSAIQLVKAVQSGRLSEKDVDERVVELLKLQQRTKIADNAPKTFDVAAHQAVAQKAAAESIVLLKNEGGILPLAKGTKVALIGDFAKNPRYQGAGSSMVNPTAITNMVDEIAGSGVDCIGYAQGYQRDGKEDAALLNEAVELAKKADVVLYCFGLAENSESEGLDRTHILLVDVQKKLLAELAKVSKSIVGVVSAGSPIETGWAGSCKAILHGYLGGQASAGAMMDVITGKICPSGKLAETLPIKLEDTPTAECFPVSERLSLYKESLFIGYRYYDTAGIPVAFPFGYGLSYTTFEYSDIKADANSVTFTITNTGKVDGKEIAQIYVAKKDSKLIRAAKELKGFTKVALKAGESKTVTVALDDKAFRYFNVRTDKWEVEGGEYTIMVGASSADIKLCAAVNVAGTTDVLPYDIKDVAHYVKADVKNATDKEWEVLLGHEIPKAVNKIDATMPFRDLKHSRSPIFMLVCAILTHLHDSSTKAGTPNLNVLFIYNMPLRALAQMTGGMIGKETVDGLVMECQGFWLIGLIRALIGFAQNAVAKSSFEKKIHKK